MPRGMFCVWNVPVRCSMSCKKEMETAQAAVLACERVG